jgi:hypothetical protein
MGNYASGSHNLLCLTRNYEDVRAILTGNMMGVIHNSARSAN